MAGYYDTLKSVAGKVFTYLASITLTGTDGKTITVTQDTSLDEAVAMSSKAPLISPSFTTPALGTPTSGVLTNCTGLPLTGLVATAWTTPTYDAANFYGVDAMTWTVDAGDVTSYAYIITGKTMTVAWWIGTTTVGGTLSTTLKIKIPAAKTSTKNLPFAYILSNAGGTNVVGFGYVAAGGTTINLNLIDSANWSAATNTTVVYGQVTFEID